mgnify:CR=1 FL=1
MLRLENINSYYGKSHIIQDVSLEIQQNEVVGLLGRNGVGKTTLLRSILGLYPPKKTGRTHLNGQDISSLPSYKVAELGIGYVPQGRRIFPHLSVYENLSICCRSTPTSSQLDEIFTYFPILKEKLSETGGSLSGGQQQMLAIARAIMPNPHLLLIDEPTEGLQPSIVKSVRETIKWLRHEGITILLADQNLDNVIELCDTVYVIEKGSIRIRETKENLNIQVLHDYLGVTRKKDRCAPGAPQT